MSAELSDEIRRRLVNPLHVCSALGLAKGAVRQSTGLLICCPAHGDRTPSCSVTRGRDGTLRVRCFGCELSGDVFNLIAARLDVDVKSEFRDVLQAAADIAGVDIDAPHRAPRPMPPMPAASPAADYPPRAELIAYWDSCVPVGDDRDAASALDARRLFWENVEGVRCVRAAPIEGHSPSWARVGGKPWREAGYRILVAVYDALGAMRSIRAWATDPGVDPKRKRVAAAGVRSTGLVMADGLARQILEVGGAPSFYTNGETPAIVIVEGEPDFLSWASRFSDGDDRAPAVFGIYNGSWTPEIAARIPVGSRVVIRTDHDDQGHRYADAIVSTLRGKCSVFRGAP